MPYEAPGARHTVDNAVKASVHGQIVEEDGFVGSAFKVTQPDRFVRPADADDIAIGEDLEIQLGGIAEAPASGNLASAGVGSDIYIRIADNVLGTITEAVTGLGQGASRVTGLVGSNNAIRWTAREDRGAPVRVQLVDPAAASQALTVDVDGFDIIVSLATSAGSALTSTAAQVIAAVTEDNDASELVTVANEGASSGAGVVAVAALAALAGGSGGQLAAGWRKVGKVTEVDLSRNPDVLRINTNVVDQVAPL